MLQRACCIARVASRVLHRTCCIARVASCVLRRAVGAVQLISAGYGSVGTAGAHPRGHRGVGDLEKQEAVEYVQLILSCHSQSTSQSVHSTQL